MIFAHASSAKPCRPNERSLTGARIQLDLPPARHFFEPPLCCFLLFALAEFATISPRPPG